jgi:hypothetical protein
MAIDDAINGGFDPNAALDDLISKQDGAPSAGVSPDLLANRLYRKMRDRQDREPVEAPKIQRPTNLKPKSDAPDFSSQGTPIEDLPDFSDQGTPIDQVKPAAPALSLGTTGQGKAFLKGIPHAAIEGAGGVLKGLGVAAAQADRETTPGMMASVAGGPPELQPTTLPPPVPTAQQPYYRAGQATQDFAQRAVPMTDQEKDSLGGRVGQGIGGVAPYLVAGAINPVLGVVAGGAGMAASTAADTFDAAIKKGASEEKAAAAAGYSALVGGALGTLPLGMVLKPIRVASPVFAGRAAGYLEEAVKSGLTFASVGEAQEYLLQKIAKDFYDPEAGYSPDAKRAIASLITGGVLGAGGHFMERRAQRAASAGAEAPEAAPSGPASLGGPDTGSAPGAEPSGAGPSGGPTPPGGAPPPRPEAERSGVGREKLEKILRYYGYSEDQIKAMSHAEMSDAVLREMKGAGPQAKPAEQAAPEQPQQPKTEAKGTQEGSKKGPSGTEATERDGLKRYGWSDEEIDQMSPAQRRREFQDAMATGQSEPSNQGEKVNTPPEATTAGSTTEPPQSATTSSPDKVVSEPQSAAQPSGKREEPIVATKAEDVQRAQPVEPTSPAQAAAENYQHAHLELPHLGLEGGRSISVETGVGQERKGVDENGKPWSVKLTHAAYGRIKGTKGADGQPLDVFIGPAPTSPHVFVIDQHHPGGGGFDEHKIMAGFNDPKAALHAYASSYTDRGEGRIGHVTAMDPVQFREWLAGDTTKPLKKEPASAGASREAGISNQQSAEATVAPAEAPKETPTGNAGAAAGRSEDKIPQEPNRSSGDSGNTGAISRSSRGSTEPLSLLQFIASKGGIEPHAELKALDLAGNHRVQLPGAKGFFGVVRPTGMPLDLMREAAEEAGYLRGEHNKTSTVRDLLDAIDTELRGHRHAAEGEEGHATKRQRGSERERSDAAREKAIIEAREDIAAEYTDLPEDLLDRAAAIMADERLDIDGAVEMAAVRMVAEDADYGVSASDLQDIFGEDVTDAIRPRPAREDGEPTGEQRQTERRPDEGEEAGGDGSPVRDLGEAGREEAEPRSGSTPTREQVIDRLKAGETSFPPFTTEPIKQDRSGIWTSRITGAGLDLPQYGMANADKNHFVDIMFGPYLHSLLERQEELKREKAEAAARSVNGIDPLSKEGAIREAVEGMTKHFTGAADKIRKAIADGAPDAELLQVIKKANSWDSYGGRSIAAGTAETRGGRLNVSMYGSSAHRAEKFTVTNKDIVRIARELYSAPTTEKTEAGEQTVLPGAEKIGHGEQAQRAADKGLKPTKAQKPADDGLFGDSMNQRDLLDHVRTVEKELGTDADNVAPVDIARAAEIMADQPGIEPSDAFGQAVIKNAVEQGFLTEQQAVEAYGEQVKDVLESGREGASGGGSSVEQGRAASDEVGPGGAEEDGELSSGREAGTQQGAGAQEAAAVQADEGTTAAGGQRADQQGGDAAENQPASPLAGLGPVARGRAIHEEAIRRYPEDTPPKLDKKGKVVESYISHEAIAFENGANGHEWNAGMPIHRTEAEMAEPFRAGLDFAGREPPLPDGAIGLNPDGDPIFEDDRGIRYTTKDGVRHTETVQMVPQGRGKPMRAEPVRRGDRFKTVEELANEKAHRDAPTWAEIMAALPKDEQGDKDVYRAFRLMAEITGKQHPAYKDLTPAEQGELLNRLRGDTVAPEEPTNGVQTPVSAGDEAAGAEAVQPAQSGGETASPRGGEGAAGKRTVRGADEGRAEGKGRVSDGAVREPSAGGRDADADRLSEPRADDAADRREKRATERAANLVEGENHTIEPGSLEEGRGPRAKALGNVEALELANKILAEDRPATAAEQKVLAQYVGWGGLKGAFPDADGKFAQGFEQIGKDLQAALSPEEYETARRSIQYAHYTAENVVRSMWGAVERLGFKGGQVFEPGMGTGNFAGMMPADIAANSHYAGIELDHTTARIAKLLYPKWGIRQDDFTKTRLPENTFDLVIGNPPFADIAIQSDPKYKQGFLLHDYFFAKSLDAVRPGGLLAFVTSAGTMNKLDPAAREYLADRADLVGAVRLPGDAFKKNAGTEVTTDIVFLRKRLPTDLPADRSWTETKQVELPGPDGTPIKGNVSGYFADHPEMVLGKPDFADKLYKGRYSVKSVSGSDLKADLAAAIERLPQDVMADWQDVNADSVKADFETTEKKEGTYYVGPDGSLHQVSGGVGFPVKQRGKGVEGGRTSGEIERIKGLVPVRDALREVYAADLAGDTANATRAREALNRHYDSFVEKFGPINKAVIQTRRPNVIQQESERQQAREDARYAGARFREGDFDDRPLIAQGATPSVIARERQKAREAAAAVGKTFDEGDFDPNEIPDVIIDKRPNVDAFMDDPESYRLRAIERYDEGTGNGHKSPVFFENVITREKKPEIKSTDDALLYSLSKYGRVNLDEMAALLRKSPNEVIEQLGDKVFQVPGTGDTFETRDEYLSGNVRKKLALAKKAAERNPAFRRNVDALEAAQPIPLAPSQIHATLGMPWIPQEHVEKFALDALGLEKAKVRYLAPLAQWVVSGDTDSVSASTTWGTTDRRAPALLQDALNRQTTKIYDDVMIDGRKSSILNVAKTEAAQDKVKAIQEKFANWIWEDQERSDALAGMYNEKFNNLVVRDYDGSYLTTPGISATWSWRPHQKRVIARIIQPAIPMLRTPSAPARRRSISAPSWRCAGSVSCASRWWPCPTTCSRSSPRSGTSSTPWRSSPSRMSVSSTPTGASSSSPTLRPTTSTRSSSRTARSG